MPITVDGKPVLVIRKRIKHMYLRVNADGNPVVSAPLHVPDEQIEALVTDKLNWIESRQARLRNKPKPPVLFIPPNTPSGVLTIFGREQPYRITDAVGLAYIPEGTRTLLIPPGDENRMLGRWAALRLSEEISKRIPLWEQRIGVKVSHWEVKSLKSRWGSCTPATKRIRFAQNLVMYPVECLDMVIAHELCHIRVSGHQQDFYALLGSVCPDWKKADALLKGYAKNAE